MTHGFPPVVKSATMCVVGGTEAVLLCSILSPRSISNSTDNIHGYVVSRRTLQTCCQRIFPKAVHFDLQRPYFSQCNTNTRDGCNDSGTRSADVLFKNWVPGLEENVFYPHYQPDHLHCALARLHPPARDKNEQGVEKSSMVKL